MAKYIDAESLYNQVVEKEELARQRVIDTPSRLPNGDVNPYATRYATQLDERTAFKFMLIDAPAVDIPRWISVTERLPEEEGRYLITGKRGAVYSLEYEDERWYGGIEPIAWMPLPEPYKGGEEE